jgi:hypothetical protein
MPAAYQLILTPEQAAELRQARDHHALPYVRVKAAALLKIAAGASIREVAAHGLLKAVRWETVKDWIRRYQQEGLAGLLVHRGRGRKPAFSPCGPGPGASGLPGQRTPAAQSASV